MVIQYGGVWWLVSVQSTKAVTLSCHEREQIQAVKNFYVMCGVLIMQYIQVSQTNPTTDTFREKVFAFNFCIVSL